MGADIVLHPYQAKADFEDSAAYKTVIKLLVTILFAT